MTFCFSVIIYSYIQKKYRKIYVFKYYVYNLKTNNTNSIEIFKRLTKKHFRYFSTSNNFIYRNTQLSEFISKCFYELHLNWYADVIPT